MKKFIAALLIAVVFSMPVCAHEFIIKPVQLNINDVGHKLPFSVLSCHVFMVSEETEPIDQVEVALIEGNNTTAVTLKQNNILMTLDGSVEVKTQGTSIIAGHRKGMIWSNTTRGWKQAGKKGLHGVISSGKYEKFCKTLVNVGKADEGYKKIIGHKLEIVPISNPAEAVIGNELNFQVLYDGSPFAVSVYATFDGFSNRPNTYAYFTETDENGVAGVKITHPGTWMVRVEKEDQQSTEDYDKHVMRAVLIFGVQ